MIGRTAAVSTGHPLTTAATLEILHKGGNAFDAGVTAMLVGGVLEQDLYSLGGEGNALLYPQREGKVISINGQGWAPRFATVEWFASRNRTMAGIGLDPAVVPGVIHTALTVLERWGTMTFAQVSARAIDYAQNGFPLRPLTSTAIEKNLKFLQTWPDNRAMWLKADGSAYGPGETIKLPALANTLTRMVDAEKAAGFERPNRRHRRGARPFLQGRHRARDGGISKREGRAVGARSLRVVLGQSRGAAHDELSRV